MVVNYVIHLGGIAEDVEQFISEVDELFFLCVYIATHQLSSEESCD